MDNSEHKKRFFDFLEVVNKEIASFTNELSDSQKAQKGSLRKWSAKDVFSHLVFWGNHFNSCLNNSRNGEKIPQAGDYEDQVNDGVLFEHMDQPFSKAQEEFNQSFRKSVELLTAFSADELNDKDIYPYLNGRTIINQAIGTFGWHIMYHISDFYLKEGQMDKAIDIQEKYTEQLRAFPDWEGNATYNLACFYSQIGEKMKALSNLKNAFTNNPDLIEWAKKDTDLDSLRGEEEFKVLIAK